MFTRLFFKISHLIPNSLLIKFGLFRFGKFIVKISNIKYSRSGWGRYYKMYMKNSNCIHYLSYDGKDIKILRKYLREYHLERTNKKA